MFYRNASLLVAKGFGENDKRAGHFRLCPALLDFPPRNDKGLRPLTAFLAVGVVVIARRAKPDVAICLMYEIASLCSQ